MMNNKKCHTYTGVNFKLQGTVIMKGGKDFQHHVT